MQASVSVSVLIVDLGLAIMIVSEAATLAQIEPFWSWNTPIAWTGFIIFADAIVWRARGDSWIRSAPREFVLLALASIPLWVVFEGLQPGIRNWHYVGLPENLALRMFGYAWSFATIWPAIFEGAELIAVIRESRGSGGSRARWSGLGKAASSLTLPTRPTRPTRRVLLRVAAGALMLASPFFVVAASRALPGGAGLARLHLSARSDQRASRRRIAVADWRAGRRDRLINLMLSGFLCGVLWEFWNYWSRAKWHYTVPIMEHLKIFEMPVPGYFGFPAFALECFTMYVFVRALACLTPGDGTVRFALRRSSPSRPRPHRRPRHAAPSADRRPRQAGDSGRRRADDPPHHQLARLAGRRRSRPEPASPPGDADRASSATARTSARASATRGSSRACSAAPAARGWRGRSSAPDTFLIVNGDTLTDVDLAMLAGAHDASGAHRHAGAGAQSRVHRVRRCAPRRRAPRHRIRDRAALRRRSYHYIGVQVVTGGGIRRRAAGRGGEVDRRRLRHADAPAARGGQGIRVRRRILGCRHGRRLLADLDCVGHAQRYG